MKLKFTHHAQYRIDERRISVERIKQTINRPDFVEQLLDGKTRSKKNFGNETLLVVYIKSSKEFLILSSYYL